MRFGCFVNQIAERLNGFKLFFFFERLKYNFSENYKGKGFLVEKYGIIALCIE